MVLVGGNTGVTLPICKAGVEWRGNGAINYLEGSEDEGIILEEDLTIWSLRVASIIAKAGWMVDGGSLLHCPNWIRESDQVIRRVHLVLQG